jgi:hypothetical protein
MKESTSGRRIRTPRLGTEGYSVAELNLVGGDLVQGQCFRNIDNTATGE